MKCLYADFNNFDQHGLLPLTGVGSQASIRSLTAPLSEGERIMLSDGEVMIVAEVRLHPDGTWIAQTIGDFSDADEATRLAALESSREL